MRMVILKLIRYNMLSNDIRLTAYFGLWNWTKTTRLNAVASENAENITAKDIPDFRETAFVFAPKNSLNNGQDALVCFIDTCIYELKSTS